MNLRWSAIDIACAALALVAVSWGGGACSSSGNVLAGGTFRAAPEPGAPDGVYLTSLSVAHGMSQGSQLVPAFAPGIRDYYVQCAAGTNALTVSMAAAPGAQSALLQPTTSVPSPTRVLSLEMEENQAIVVAATDGSASAQYWVRCLPADFPPMRMDTGPQAVAPTPGYYLVGSQSASGGPGYAIVLDVDGVPVWYHREDHRIWDVDDVVSGALTFYPDKTSTGFQFHQLAPFETTYLEPRGDSADIHELRSLPNGNFLLFANNLQTGVDLSGFTIALPDGGVETFGPDGTIRPCTILEVEPTGDVAWQWVATDHFDPTEASTFGHEELVPPKSDGTPIADPFHCNSIDVDPANGNLLVSARNMDSLFYIDRSTGAVVWKMGGSPSSKDGAIYVPVNDPFHRQHDARLQPGWSTACSGGRGQISLFDDETSTTNAARALLLDVTVGPSDRSLDCKTPGASVTWQHAGSYSSSYMGSFRVFPDGTSLIGWGDNGEADLVFSELDAHGDDILDFHFTDGSASYRSIKVPLARLDLDLMRQTAGLP